MVLLSVAVSDECLVNNNTRKWLDKLDSLGFSIIILKHKH